MTTCLLCTVFCLHGQEYSWKNYNIADGLPQTQVICLMQDSDGFLWMGTKNGISIFDGIEFKNYTSRDGLDFDHISAIQEYKKGEIIIGTYSGVNLMKDGKFTHLIRNLDGWSNFIYLDSDSNFWFNRAELGLCTYESGYFVTTAPIFDKLPEGERIDQLLPRKSDGKLIFFTSFGNVFIPSGNDFKKIGVGEIFRNVVEGEDGKYYGSTDKGIFMIDENGASRVKGINGRHKLLHIIDMDEMYIAEYMKPDVLYHYKNGQMTRVSPRFGLISQLIIDDEDNIWLGTDKGLWKVQNKAFQNYKANPENDDYTWSVLQDKNGDYVFGSYNNSLQKLVNGTFQDIPQKHLNNPFPISYYSGGIKTTSGDLLITTAVGALRYDGDRLSWLFRPRQPSSILYIYDDRKYNKYLLASSNHGLVEIDDQGNTRVYDDREPWEHTELITSILRDKYDRIWISGKKGISIREENRWRHLPDDKDSIPVGAISMLLDSRQNIWLGSNDGLYFYDYKRLQKIHNQALNTQIGVLNLTDDGKLIIGGIGSIGVVDLDDFYSSGNAHVRIYDHNSGFLGDECKHNSSFKDDEGNIWICTSNRVVKITPEYLTVNLHPPRVYMKSISSTADTLELRYINNSGNDMSPLTLERKYNNLRFNYHAISHTLPTGVRYISMLEGYDDSWSDETTERFRSYTNLPGGHYTFKVKARNHEGLWADGPAMATIFIKPAWHELLSVRIGGIVGALLFAAGIGYLYSERKRKQQQREARIERDVARLQFKSLKGMLDPHFTFNAINAIASMMYRGEKDEAYGYFSKFSRLIRNLFEHAETATRSLEAELEFVTMYLELEKMRFGGKFDFAIHMDDAVDRNREIPKLIIQIYVENAIKHGLMGFESGGMITVSISKGEHSLHIFIRDNGVGRENSKISKDAGQSLGKGTHIIREYFALLNRFNESKISVETNDLYAEDKNPAGTEVHITIPHTFRFSL